uniref:HNH endonuclease n=1 Tax=Clostridium sp. TaxID=1506 RepID=UPI0026057085
LRSGAEKADNALNTVNEWTDKVGYNIKKSLGMQEEYAGVGDMYIPPEEKSVFKDMVSKITGNPGNGGKFYKGYSGNNEFHKVDYDAVVATGRDKSGKVVEKWVIPKGYESVDDFLEKVSDDELKAMGYNSKEEFSEVVTNLQNYLNNGKGARLINQKYAGTVDKVGVKRDVLGFPIFEEGDKVFEGDLKESLYKASDNDQFRESTKQLKEAIEKGKVDSSIFSPEQLEQIKNGDERIEGYIWHHHQVTGRMQLVKDIPHNPAKHTGGKALWGGGNENR